MNTLLLTDIAAAAGYLPAEDGKLALPNTQAACDAIAAAARRLALGGREQWVPGDEPVGDITLSGAGPVWAYLAAAHALHGIAGSLTYASPMATLVIYRHG